MTMMQWIGLGMMILGGILFEIVMGDLLILLSRPKCADGNTASDRATLEFEGLVIHLGDSIQAGWTAFKNHPGPPFFFTILAVAVWATLSLIPFVGAFWGMIVQFMATCSFMLVYQESVRGHHVTFSMFFTSWDSMAKGTVAMVLAGILTLFGMIPSVFFGMYLSLTFSMVACVAMDPALHHLTVTEMMSASRKIFHYHAWKLFVFHILSFLIFVVGALFMGIGIFAAIPVIMYAQADIYYGHRMRNMLPDAHTDEDYRAPLISEITPQ
jgi:hypothetical protein